MGWLVKLITGKIGYYNIINKKLIESKKGLASELDLYYINSLRVPSPSSEDSSMPKPNWCGVNIKAGGKREGEEIFIAIYISYLQNNALRFPLQNSSSTHWELFLFNPHPPNLATHNRHLVIIQTAASLIKLPPIFISNFFLPWTNLGFKSPCGNQQSVHDWVKIPWVWATIRVLRGIRLKLCFHQS